jgi:hypothetical protein
MASHTFWEWVISPNHNEIVVVDGQHSAPPRDIADLLVEWGVTPNHNEIVVVDEA